MNLLQVGLFTTLVASAPVFATTLEFQGKATGENGQELYTCLLYTSPSPRD